MSGKMRRLNGLSPEVARPGESTKYAIQSTKCEKTRCMEGEGSGKRGGAANEIQEQGWEASDKGR